MWRPFEAMNWQRHTRHGRYHRRKTSARGERPAFVTSGVEEETRNSVLGTTLNDQQADPAALQHLCTITGRASGLSMSSARGIRPKTDVAVGSKGWLSTWCAPKVS